MKRHLASCIFLGLLGLQGNAMAASFNYNVVSLAYLNQTVEVGGISGDLKADGVELNAAFEVNKQFVVRAVIGNANGDVTISGTKVTLDVEARMLGILFHAPIAQKTDVVLGASLLQGELKAKVTGFPTLTESMDGQNILLGVRHMLGNKFELQAGVDQSCFDDTTDTNLNLGFEGYVMKDVSLGLNVSTNEDSQSTYLVVSKYF